MYRHGLYTEERHGMSRTNSTQSYKNGSRFKEEAIWIEAESVRTVHTAAKTTSWRPDWNLQDPNRKRPDWQSDIFPAGHRHSQLTRTFKEVVCSTVFYHSSEVILQPESDQQCWNALPQHVVDVPSTNAVKNRLDKHWMDMGTWKFRLTSPSTTRQVQVQVKQLTTKHLWTNSPCHCVNV